MLGRYWGTGGFDARTVLWKNPKMRDSAQQIQLHGFPFHQPKGPRLNSEAETAGPFRLRKKDLRGWQLFFVQTVRRLAGTCLIDAPWLFVVSHW